MSPDHTRRIIPGIGERVRELRRTHDLSQQVLAVRAGTTTGIIVQVERHNLTSTATLNRLARAFGDVSVDQLTGRNALAAAR